MIVAGRDVRAVWWEGDERGGRLAMVDQRLLPHRLATITTDSVAETVTLIRDMAVRGAPSVGAAAAYGMVLGRDDPRAARAALASSRPTARDLFTALEWMGDRPTLARAEAYVEGIVSCCRRIGEHGAAVLARLADRRGRLNVLTHCHAGALATVDHGTALAPLHRLAATRPDIVPFVWVGETRPRLQGAITAWELRAAGIRHKVTVDSAAGLLMARGEVDVVIVGADRIARNGDVANKVGTYPKALLAWAHDIPFYVAAPGTTWDAATADGEGIPIEEREGQEVLYTGPGSPFGSGTEAVNPAFDVTPAALVTGYITESGLQHRARPAGRMTAAP